MNEQWFITDAQTIDTNGIKNLSIKLIGGRVDVVGHESDDVRVDVSEVNGQPIEVRQDGSTLTISHVSRAGSWFEQLFTDGIRGTMNDSAVVTVLVPLKVAAEVGTVNADALLSELDGAQSVKTVNGSILTAGTRGDLRVMMVNGDVSIRDHHGTLTAKATSGEISASGDFKDINAKTVAGDVTLDLASPTPTVNIKTVSGNALVRVPKGVGVELAAKVVSGRVTLGTMDMRNATGKIALSDGPKSSRAAVTFSSVSGNVSVLFRNEKNDADTQLPASGTDGAGLAE